MTPKEIEKRYNGFCTLSWALGGEILSTVRLISLEWNQEEPNIYFYIEDKVTEKLREDIDDPFHHVDMDDLIQYNLKIEQVKSPATVEYRGDCYFADYASEDTLRPLILKERSRLFSQDIETLIKKPKKQLVTYRNSELHGWGELVEFTEPIGLYLNPTTKETTSTNKAIIYYGKNKTYVIPAVSNFSWFENLEKEFQNEGSHFNLLMHTFMEAKRALLGRVTPPLESFQIFSIPEAGPYLLSFTVYNNFTDEDRELLELVWFELQAGMPREIVFDGQFLLPEKGYDRPLGGMRIYSKKAESSERFRALLSPFRKMERRLWNLAAIETILKGKIPFGTRAISIAWMTKPIIIEFALQASPEITEKEKAYFIQTLDELCRQINSDPPRPSCTFTWSNCEMSDHYGECIFSTDPREKGQYSRRYPGFYAELSDCTHLDVPFLIGQKSNKQLLKTFRIEGLSGYGELVNFEMVVGNYLNPTTHESSVTKKAMIYYGIKKVEVIPALPDAHWFLKLQKEFATEGKTIDFSVHIQREAHRALLGRVPSSLIAMILSYKNEPYVVTFYVTSDLTRSDRSMLGLVWFEMMAGMPVELEFQAQFIEVKNRNEVDQGDYCVYLRKEIET